MRHLIHPIFNPLKTGTIMNKTAKTLLKVLGYLISLLLGAAGGATML